MTAGANKVKRLMVQFNERCCYCGCLTVYATPKSPNHATIDHDIPKARGGRDFQNTVLACVRCNGAKGDMTGEEFRHFIAKRRLAKSYVAYLEARLDKIMAGRAPIVVHTPGTVFEPRLTEVEKSMFLRHVV